ncbi:hypothetical protein EV702DRAFT_1046647 [Suillus placidus]|uniref:Retrotransposon gag domain-containing protein n=1 Tax=Suillus placidus TaxID=48579 RepID=A0A9P6ZS35_9AGAM|nr:hypothetical protein EV702DRAFT_1046647 [Suillus placidus]
MSTTTAAVTPQSSFYGDYEKGEEPTDWIRKYQLSFPPSYSDTEKIARFELQCAAASPAESWFTNLPATDKASWAQFLAAFRTQWPPPAQVTLTVTQKKDHIRALKKIEEENGDTSNGQRRSREWLKENTPEILRDFLSDNYSTWTDFEADVAKVSASQLLKAKQRLAMERKLREDVDKLQTQANNGRKPTAPSPASSNQTTYGPVPAFRYSYRFGTPPATMSQPQSVAPPPTYQAPLLPAVPQIPQMPQGSNLFTATAPVTRGNLFYGYRGYPQTPTRSRGGSPADRARTVAQYATIPHHPDSDMGRQAYTQQIQEWHTQHGTKAIPNSQRPYPLKPGTSPIGSRECFNCGMAMAPPHQAYDCPNTPLPPQETKWRETISRLVSRALAPAATPGPTTNIQYVTSVPTPPVNAPFAAPHPVSYPQYSYYPEPYEMYDIAGNEYGPQQ